MEKEQFEVIKNALTKILNNTDRSVVESNEFHHEVTLDAILDRVKSIEDRLAMKDAC